MMKGAYIIVGIFLIMVSRSASACQVYTLEHAFKTADSVFVGTVKEISLLPKSEDEMQPSDNLFHVSKKLKGEISQMISIRDTGNNCYGLPQFNQGDEYLVFAVQNGEHFETCHPLPNMKYDSNKAKGFVENVKSE